MVVVAAMAVQQLIIELWWFHQHQSYIDCEFAFHLGIIIACFDLFMVMKFAVVITHLLEFAH